MIQVDATPVDPGAHANVDCAFLQNDLRLGRGGLDPEDRTAHTQSGGWCGDQIRVLFGVSGGEDKRAFH
jgi:hypothetical protein